MASAVVSSSRRFLPQNLFSVDAHVLLADLGLARFDHSAPIQEHLAGAALPILAVEGDVDSRAARHLLQGRARRGLHLLAPVKLHSDCRCCLSLVGWFVRSENS